MFNFLKVEKECGPVLGRKRRRLQPKAFAAFAAPKKRAEELAKVRAVLRFIGRGLLFGLQLFEYPELVRQRGPGLRPEQRYEFEDLLTKEAARRLGWF